jgi:hypothetical protein
MKNWSRRNYKKLLNAVISQPVCRPLLWKARCIKTDKKGAKWMYLYKDNLLFVKVGKI